ncbi:MAG: type II toxin-antitoxin system HigB family toxin [Polyangiales bacterium]
MRVFNLSTLRAHWSKPGREDSKGSLAGWFKETKAAKWESPADVKARYATASFVGDRIVFNIRGNKYRLIVRVAFGGGAVFIRFIGTHQEYDQVDASTV